MERSGLRRVITIVVVLAVIIAAIFALISIGRTLFGGSSANPSSSPSPTNTAQQALTSTLADRSVRMIVRGPLVANENFHSYTITISPDARNMTTYTGYIGEPVETSQLTNNLQAYEQLVYALDRANLMEGTPLTGEANDTRGICASGNIYEFETLQAGNSVRKLWTSTCRGSVGSLKANLTQVGSLFRAQIPEFTRLSGKINLF